MLPVQGPPFENHGSRTIKKKRKSAESLSRYRQSQPAGFFETQLVDKETAVSGPEQVRERGAGSRQEGL